MEGIASPEIGRGFDIGVHNSRGAHWRGEGGAQERELAAKYRAWAERLHFDYPYVGAVIEGIAKSYEHEAGWQDSKAKITRNFATERGRRHKIKNNSPVWRSAEDQPEPFLIRIITGASASVEPGIRCGPPSNLPLLTTLQLHPPGEGSGFQQHALLGDAFHELGWMEDGYDFFTA